ncbi:MAG: type IV pilin [archaeon]|nr:type IV pilin [archaeon]
MYNIKRKKKGISPVIASIILIAITIAVAIAVAGWVFGLFGTYGTSGGVTITVTSLDAATKTVTYTVTNSKSTAVTIDICRIPGTDLIKTGVADTVDAGTTESGSTAVLTGTAPTVGMQYTIQFILTDGTVLSSSATAS